MNKHLKCGSKHLSTLVGGIYCIPKVYAGNLKFCGCFKSNITVDAFSLTHSLYLVRKKNTFFFSWKYLLENKCALKETLVWIFGILFQSGKIGEDWKKNSVSTDFKRRSCKVEGVNENSKPYIINLDLWNPMGRSDELNWSELLSYVQAQQSLAHSFARSADYCAQFASLFGILVKLFNFRYKIISSKKKFCKGQ